MRNSRSSSGQRLQVERDAGGLHPGQHRDERQLDVAEESLERRVLQPSLKRVADRDRREGVEPGAGRRRQLVGRRQDLVQVLGDDIGDGLRTQCRIEDVGRDLRVEGDRLRADRRVLREAGDEDRLDLVPHDRRGEPGQQVAQRIRGFSALRGDHATVGTGDGECQRRPSARPWVVEQQRDADGGLGRQPRFEVGDPIGAADLDPAGIDDRGGQRGRQVRGLERAVRVGGGVAVAVGGAGAIACRRGWSGHRVEVEPELELAAFGPARHPARSPALRPAGDPGRRHVAALGDRAQALGALLGALPGDRRQALDERPELVLAE